LIEVGEMYPAAFIGIVPKYVILFCIHFKFF
jgi:hypothetical protein